ncbi:MAG: phosphoglycerate mutase [Pseudomonadota bacterium]
MTIQKTLLCILDGFAFGDENFAYNAYARAKKTFFPKILNKYPHKNIQCSGVSVGLPDGQMGNSEVGHLTIGAGKVIHQMLEKISLSFQNKEFKQIDYIKNLLQKNTQNVHLIGLFSEGGVHSHCDHIMNIATVLSEKHNVFLHIIGDGRDCPTQDLLPLLKKTLQNLLQNVHIATISGRYFAMDRDNRWDRIETYYNTLTSIDENKADSILDYISNSYQNGVTDEFIQPAILTGFNGIKDGESVVFCNFRSDRMRQIVDVFSSQNFDKFNRKITYHKLNIAIMTDYFADNKATAIARNLAVLFIKDEVKNTISEVVSKAGLKQLKISETEKYAHVTFFLNGEVEKPFDGEDRILIPSKKVQYYNQAPEMCAYEICDEIVNAMENKDYSLIVCNIANGDMVGHTGDFVATVKTVEVVDDVLSKIYNVAIENNFAIIITADHGNIECMQHGNNEIHTQHTTGDVPLILINKNASAKQIEDVNSIADIKKLVLNVMNI